MSENFDYNFKIILVGEGGVGKSSLIRKYCYNEFTEATPHTLGLSKEVKIEHYNDRTVMLNI